MKIEKKILILKNRVALDDKDEPVSLSLSGDNSQNIIMWMDHRALEQATKINNTGHDVLKYVGNKISLEMEVPKLLWIKEKLSKSWNR